MIKCYLMLGIFVDLYNKVVRDVPKNVKISIGIGTLLLCALFFKKSLKVKKEESINGRYFALALICGLISLLYTIS